MALADILQARAAAQGRTATVACGELGELTVESLPLRELQLLYRGPDGARAVFYAACRELQTAGEELRRAGKVYTPDGILQFVSDSEAEQAARTILELSGFSPDSVGQLDEKRLESVQEFREVRPDSVQLHDASEGEAGFSEIRPASVQEIRETLLAGGQVSREFRAENDERPEAPESDKIAQEFGILPTGTAQNIVSEYFAGERISNAAHSGMMPLHETESDLHENKSEVLVGSGAVNTVLMHEITSDFAKRLHETESDFGKSLHETKSEMPDPLHEIESENLRKGQWEMHEIESEQAEIFARRLLEGLRRAKWVRGG